MTICSKQTNTGAYLFQLHLPARHAKLALNRSHYLIADEGRWTELEVGGKVRPCRVMVKIWIPVPRKDRADEGIRSAETKRRLWHSPMLA